MSRYLERAENIARLVDINLQLILDLPSKQADQLAKDWSPLVASLGHEEEFRAHHRKVDAQTVAAYLVFERQATDSVVNCLANARENARTVREQISPEMWEQINRTYLWSISKGARQYFERNAYEFFQRITKSLQLFQGIVETGMIREEGWEFLQMGRFLERADKLTRLLDDQFHLLRLDESGQLVDEVFHWLAVLRSCHARETYQRLYPSVVQATHVAELLLLDENFPRSVLFCVSRVDRALRRLSGVATNRFSNEVEKLSGRLLSELRFSAIEDIFEAGLHRRMDDLQVQLNAIGNSISEVYIHPPLAQPVILQQAAQTQQ